MRLKFFAPINSGLVMLSLYLLSASAGAETLTLESAFKTARESNAAIQASRSRLALAEAEIETAGARMNPALVSDNGVAEKTYRFGIEHTLELGGKRKSRMAVAEARRALVLAELKQQEQELRGKIRRAYSRAYYLSRREQTLSQMESRIQSLLHEIRNREQTGKLSRLERLRQEVEALTRQQELAGNPAEPTIARHELNHLLQRPPDAPLDLAPPSVPTEVQSDAALLLKQASVSRSDIQKQQAETVVLGKEELLNRANRVPNLTLTVGPDLVFDDTNNLTANVFAIGRMEVPVFNRQQGPLREIAAQKTRLHQESGALENRIRLEVSNAAADLAAQQNQVRQYEKVLLPMAQEIQAQGEHSASPADTISAEQDLAEIRLGYLDALMAYQDKIAALEEALGLGLE